MRLLIADDDPVSSRLLEATLQRLGHEVVKVSNGSDALASLLADDGPRLAILDWMMPGLDGPTVCRRVRERPSPYVYLVLLTARGRHEDMIYGLDSGADDFLTKPLNPAELQARLSSGARIVESESRLLAAQEALRAEATRDHLTGLWNRRMVFGQLGREVRRANHERRTLAVVMADLDHFKSINDSHGHTAGDAVLKEAAQRMRSALRDYDFIGRYGGEEFLILLPGCDVEAARDVAERVRVNVSSEPIAAGNATVTVTVSLGVACTEPGCETANGLIEAADAALYRAKASGRNRVETADGAALRVETSVPVKNLRILVVDDDRLARKMVRDTLEEAGFQVRTAVDGTDAFRTIPGFDPHVIVMDIVMPGENGYRVCRSIKELGSHGMDPAPKVLLLTSRRVDDEAEREGVLLSFSQADGMMYKPFEPTALLDRVRELLAG
jgi:diguanylate cyclase (GGDEF)-like protein